MRISDWSSRVLFRSRDTIAHLSSYQNRYYASPAGKASAEWIRDSWAALAAGRSDVTTELFTACATCSTQPSVVLTIEGTTLREEVVVLGAHLDSINRSEEHTSELQSLMRTSYAVFCLKKKTQLRTHITHS